MVLGGDKGVMRSIRARTWERMFAGECDKGEQAVLEKRQYKISWYLE